MAHRQKIQISIYKYWYTFIYDDYYHHHYTCACVYGCAKTHAASDRYEDGNTAEEKKLLLYEYILILVRQNGKFEHSKHV